jgi:hypothetical protein
VGGRKLTDQIFTHFAWKPRIRSFRCFTFAGFYAFIALARSMPPIPIMEKQLEKLMVPLLLVTALQLHGQSYVYDQESATTPEIVDYDSLIISRQMLMQSFVPTLSSIDFVQLEITDYPDSSTSGASLSVALWSGSIQAPTFITGTGRVSLPANFNNDGIGTSGIATFNFATTISLTPEETYYIEPVEIIGDNIWSVAVTDNTYPYGQLYGGATAFTPTTDLWFREGVIVPEPSELALWTIGGLLIAGVLRFKGEIQPQLAF